VAAAGQINGAAAPATGQRLVARRNPTASPRTAGRESKRDARMWPARALSGGCASSINLFLTDIRLPYHAGGRRPDQAAVVTLM
jgi:hypothetical protein